MIALDAMGGDLAPAVTVHGAINAAKKGVHVCLYGDQDQMEKHLTHIDQRWQSLPLTLIHCSQVIDMGAEPSRAVLRYPDSSLVRAVKAVVDGQAQATVSAGNSGAALVAGTLLLSRIEGITRPALAALLPTHTGCLLCLDLGASTDCKVEYLEQFALMGHVYMQLFHGITQPRIALLSNGSEPYKGSLLVKQAYVQLQHNKQLNFVGNLESRDIFDDYADVLVCDGFTGNIMLKAIQGTSRAFGTWLQAEGKRSYLGMLRLMMSAPLLQAIKRKTDYASRGGALLLGVRHPLVVAHGCSTALAIEQALLYANTLVEQQWVNSFEQAWKKQSMPSGHVTFEQQQSMQQ